MDPSDVGRDGDLPDPTLTVRFDAALTYAADAHRDHARKATKIPYVSHLLAVGALVLENGGTEDQAIAALLHDVVEDRGGQPRLDDVRLKFGPEVARLVEALSDSVTEDESTKAPWEERKVEYLEHLADIDDDVLLVSVADKLHNARSILADRRQVGDEVFERFTPIRQLGLEEGRAKVAWYYRSLADVYDRRLAGRKGEALAAELQRTLAELFGGGSEDRG